MTSSDDGAMPAFDIEEVKARLGLPDEILATLFNKFATDYASVDTSLLELIDAQDAPAAADLAHSVKGASGSLGMTGVSAIAADIEQASRAGDLDGARPKVAALKAAIDAVIAQVNAG